MTARRPLKSLILHIVLCAMAVGACGAPQTRDVTTADRRYAGQLVERLAAASPGDIIDIPEGVFAFDRTLVVAADNLILRGQGADRTILSFQDQVMGSQGVRITANRVSLESLAIEDPVGDGVSVLGSDGVGIRGVRVEWTGGPAADNGAHGIALDEASNILIEDSIAIGAAVAGLHLGQSRNVVVRGNRTESNLVGIQVENTIGADLHDNAATRNTAGILVSSTPGQGQVGRMTRIFHNHLFANNVDNPAPARSPLAALPAGSGIVLSASDQVEIFGNVIADNRTANMIITARQSSGLPATSPPDGFDPYPEAIHIHGNTFHDGGNNPDGLDLQGLRLVLAGPLGRLPDILWDGHHNGENGRDGAGTDHRSICLEDEEADIVNTDAANEHAQPHIVTQAHECALPPLPAIQLEAAGRFDPAPR